MNIHTSIHTSIHMNIHADPRPDPDSLLDLISHDPAVTSRGRLKVFFGASAGVGKTYAMLLEARLRRQEGIDIVVGIVETHGRADTAELLKDIPILPLQEINHRGVTLQEFDLEAALARQPALILVDELAHTNVPGSRHPKRWQDVEELLHHGIDVYTTLNVQHLESMNDTIAKLTGVVVRETVPDSIFDQADDIELIDIPSSELLKRLQEGKVYWAPGASQRAADHFFKKSNLVALRELALRRTAERVDAQHDALNTAPGHVRLGQKLLVCVGHDALSAQVIRHAKRMAVRTKATWYALYVESGRHEWLTEKARFNVDRNLRLAEKMGAHVVRLSGSSAVEEILNYARHQGVTQIVVGYRYQTGGFEWLQRPLFTELVHRGVGLEVTAVTESVTPDPSSYVGFWRHHWTYPSGYALAGVLLVLATLVGLLLRPWIEANHLTMLYLAAVVIIAARWGTGPSIMASLLSVGAFNFFFTEPYYTFEIDDQGYHFTFVVMLLTSLLVGSQAAKLALQARQARQREQETHAFYALTRELSALRDTTRMTEVAIKHLHDAFGMEAVIFLPEEGQFRLMPAYSPARELKEQSVARWVFQNGVIAGRSTDTLPSAKGLYAPLVAEKEIVGVLGLLPSAPDHRFTSDEISRLETNARVLASALQRTLRASEAEAAKIESESEKLRNVLLSSVSHDLRTPLASITGAASSALLLKDQLPKDAVDLLQAIYQQATRLAKLVTNLLDVTSLESGTVRLQKQPYFIAEVIGAALTRVQDSRGQRTITVHLAPELPLIDIDGLLIEQMLVNLLDNAIRHTAAQGRITLTVERQADLLQFTLSDNGTGLTPGEEERIFEKFYSLNRARGSAGLGLAICKGIVKAHGGHISARNNAHGGACFTVTLPGLKPATAWVE